MLLDTSTVVDKRIVDKTGDKTAILKKYKISTKILFCRHNNVLFWKRKDTFKKQYIYSVKISLQKGLAVCEKHAFKRLQQHACAQPTTVYPASLNDPSRRLKFGFWSERHCIISWPLFCWRLSPSCRQRNLSSTTALLDTASQSKATIKPSSKNLACNSHTQKCLQKKRVGCRACNSHMDPVTTTR